MTPAAESRTLRGVTVAVGFAVRGAVSGCLSPIME